MKTGRSAGVHRLISSIAKSTVFRLPNLPHFGQEALEDLVHFKPLDYVDVATLAKPIEPQFVVSLLD